MTSEKQVSKKAMLQAFLLYPLMLGFSASVIITILRVFEPSSSSIKAIFFFAFAISFGYAPLLGIDNFRHFFIEQKGTLIAKIKNDKEQQFAFAAFVGFLVTVGILFHSNL